MEGTTRLTRLLSTLPGDNMAARGSAFELVSDWGLRHSVDFGADISSIERYETWAHRNGLLGARDLGVDRIVTTHTGELWAVQNKGYAADATVPLPELTNFIVAAKTIPGVTRRILVTSGRGLTGNARNIARASGEQVIVLDRRWLENACEWPETFDELTTNLNSSATAAPAFRLRLDQQQGVERIMRHFRDGAREVQVHAACGTGKTVLSEAIQRAYGANLYAFFVPSLGLMRQTIRSWRRQRGADGMNAIAVCSDDSVGDPGTDRMSWSDEDIPCEVLHDAGSVAHYLRTHPGTPERPTVVFVTYQSEHLIIDAQHKHGAPDFDIAFLDEAHYLVPMSSRGRRMGERVKRKNDGKRRLRADHRIYATATPRVVSTRAKRRLERAGSRPLESMDHDSQVFGPIAHTLTFGEAITLGILSGYQVSVVAVPEQKYADWVNKRAYVEADGGDVLDAQTYAALQAVKLAREQGDRRMFTFHNRVDSARRFAELLTTELGIEADAVWGEMKASDRDVRLSRMNRPEGHVLTNVACLNEGVDVPALDTVVFVDPKSSPSDIVQSIGRVLRSSPGKSRGNIVIPIAVAASDWDGGELTDDERDEVMSGPSPYRRVLEVLNALSNHDEMIRHVLTALRLQLGARRGQKPLDRDEPDDGSTERDLEREIEDFARKLADGELNRGDHAPVPADATSLFDGGRIVLHAPGMSEQTRELFASKLRLAVVRESTGDGHATEWDHLYQILVYGHGRTWAEADEIISRVRAGQMESEAA